MPLESKRQKAMSWPLGLQRNPSRIANSSSLTQSAVPLTIVGLPSEVRRVIFPLARSSTQRSLAWTYATRVPSGENLANMRLASGLPAPSFWSLPLATSRTQ